jgi:N-acetyl sugar amidotransferase
MPDTRPGLEFNEQGVCIACVRHDARKEINWNDRWNQLLELADTIRPLKNRLGYNCIIAVSGGKDSHAQVRIVKEKLKLNPLLVTVNNLPKDWTDTGMENAANLINAFDCERIGLDLSPATAKKMFRYSFEKYGSPTWFWDRAVYTYPLYMASMMNIPHVFYGENISWEYGGPAAEDTPLAHQQLENNVALSYTLDDFKEAGITDLDRVSWMVMPIDVLNSVSSYYLSYYIPWSGYDNLSTAKMYGFSELKDWERRCGFIEQYDQIDAWGYLVHCWMKYPKYGHARATDVASYWIREGRISRERGMRLVEENDHILDGNIKSRFMQFCGYTHNQFRNIVFRHTKPVYLNKVLKALGEENDCSLGSGLVGTQQNP